MARKPINAEFHSSDVKTEQKPDIVDPALYDGDIVQADPSVTDNDYTEELKFNEEPVLIRLEQSAEKNSATVMPVWCNGKMAEVFLNGRWVECGYLPTGVPITVKRKILAIIAGTKVDRVETVIEEPKGQDPINKTQRFTSPLHSFSVIRDPNPRGPAWLNELLRRNA